MKKTTDKTHGDRNKFSKPGKEHKNSSNNGSFVGKENKNKGEAKWKFKGSASKVTKMPMKGKGRSNSRTDFKKDKRKSSKRIFNSEGVGPNYKKGSSALPKRQNNVRKKGKGRK